MSPRPCGVGLAVAGLIFRCCFVRAGRRWWRGGSTNGRVVASSLCVAGCCGVVPPLWACFFPFRGVRRLDRVTPTVSVPCLGAVLCFCVPCWVVLCFAVLRRVVLRCAAVPLALPCRAVSCHAMVCLAVAWQVAPCCAALRCVMSCCAVLWCALSGCAAGQCVVLWCAVLRRAVPCFAVPWCVAGPSYLRSGVGWRWRWLGSWLHCVGRGLVLCGCSAAGRRGLVWCGSLSLCCKGLGVPLGLVDQAGVHGVALLRGLCLGPLSSGTPCP